MIKKLIYLFIFNCFFILELRADNQSLAAYEGFPQAGVLAANGNLPGGSLALPQLPMGLLGQPIPLSGSLSQSKDRQWMFSVINKTDKVIKVVVEIIQYDGNRNKLSTSKFQYKLKAGASGDGKVPSATNSTGCVLYLKGWSWG